MASTAQTKRKWRWWEKVILPVIGSGGIGAVVLALANHGGGHRVATENASGSLAIGDHATAQTVNILQPTNNLVPSLPQELDYIDGTKCTHAELKEMFPFGYVVFSFREGRWTFQPHSDGHLETKVAWENVKITPDFARRTVTWTIPNISYSLPRTGLSGGRNAIENTFPLKVGKAYKDPGFVILGEPATYVAALSDNQRFPVFVLGFRIPPEMPEGQDRPTR